MQGRREQCTEGNQGIKPLYVYTIPDIISQTALSHGQQKRFRFPSFPYSDVNYRSDFQQVAEYAQELEAYSAADSSTDSSFVPPSNPQQWTR